MENKINPDEELDEELTDDDLDETADVDDDFDDDSDDEDDAASEYNDAAAKTEELEDALMFE